MPDNVASSLSGDLARFAVSAPVPDTVLGFASRAFKNGLACVDTATDGGNMRCQRVVCDVARFHQRING